MYGSFCFSLENHFNCNKNDARAHPTASIKLIPSKQLKRKIGYNKFDLVRVEGQTLEE